MKKYRGLIILFVIIIVIVIGIITSNEKVDYLKGDIKIEVSIKDYGKMQFLLYADKCPITVTNFIKLVNDKFYDGLKIHRVLENFVIQGGDPSGDGSGGSADSIKGEFTSNGVENDIKHKRGVISMARRSNDYNSASSQFFIMQKDNTTLDGEYAAFGEIINGIEVVDNIVDNVKEYTDSNGLVKDEKKPIIEYIKVIE